MYLNIACLYVTEKAWILLSVFIGQLW